MISAHGPLRVGVGGPVGTGKTALMDALCRRFVAQYEVAAITNDIYTKEDAEFLTRAGSLPPERIMGIETGGCPHTAIREDASINLAGVAEMRRRFPGLDVILIESGGDNLAATFSPELADLMIYVIDRWRQDPAQGRPGHHPQRPAGDQQDRPRPACRREPRSYGPRQPAHARRAAVRVHQYPRRKRGGRGGTFHRAPGRVGANLNDEVGGH
jgi:hypothetical protein